MASHGNDPLTEESESRAPVNGGSEGVEGAIAAVANAAKPAQKSREIGVTLGCERVDREEQKPTIIR